MSLGSSTVIGNPSRSCPSPNLYATRSEVNGAEWANGIQVPTGRSPGFLPGHCNASRDRGIASLAIDSNTNCKPPARTISSCLRCYACPSRRKGTGNCSLNFPQHKQGCRGDRTHAMNLAKEVLEIAKHIFNREMEGPGATAPRQPIRPQSIPSLFLPRSLFAETEFANTAVSSASRARVRVFIESPFRAPVSPCFPMGVLPIISLFLVILDFRRWRIRWVRLQKSESDRFPFSEAPHSRHVFEDSFRALGLTPSRQSAEHHSPGSPFRVQLTEPSSCPHLSQAFVTQMPRSCRNFWLCSLVSFMRASSIVSRLSFRGRQVGRKMGAKLGSNGHKSRDAW